MSEQTAEQVVEEIEDIDLEDFLHDHPELSKNPVTVKLMGLITQVSMKEGLDAGAAMAFSLTKDYLETIYNSQFYYDLSGSNRMAVNVALGYVEEYLDNQLSVYDAIDGEETNE